MPRQSAALAPLGWYLIEPPIVSQPGKAARQPGLRGLY